MSFNTRQYEWADVTAVLGGRDLTGIRAVKYTEKVEKEAVYAKGRNPHSIQSGNRSVEGEISVLQSELLALEAAGGGSVMGLSLDLVVSYGNPANGDAMTTDRLVSVSFTESSKELKQGDKFMEVSLPFIAIDVRKGI